jgi:uncharacterized membrane protein YvbJ
MKCPQCGKSISNQARACKYCRTKIVRQSDKMAGKLIVSGKTAIICGFVLALVGVSLLLTGAYVMGGIALAIGTLTIFMGKRIG